MRSSESPSQKDVLPPGVIWATGGLITVVVRLSVSEPQMFDAVTVKVPAVVTLSVAPVAPEDHWYVSPPEAVSMRLEPLHRVVPPVEVVMDATGKEPALIETTSVLVPQALLTVSVTVTGAAVMVV